jgi:hypothetical protein
VLPLHHGPVKRTTRLERASPEWRSGALPSELRPLRNTPGWTRTSGLCRRRTALSPLSYGRVEEPPAGVEPAPRPYKGGVLAVDTTEARLNRACGRRFPSSTRARTVETVGVDRHLPRCKRGARPVELHPLVSRTRGPPPSTAQVWLAGVEPAISGARSRWGGQLPYSQKTNEYPRRDSNPQLPG